jgi:pyruvate,orthophosphate dikinase
VILVRVETSPEDIHGMHAARGILTARGGMTSHAAVVARGMGRPCVSGAGTLAIDAKAGKLFRVGGVARFREGDIITIDGGTGEVMFGAVPTVQPELSGDFGTLMEWADAVRRLKVRTNAETPLDCRTAREFGAEGIGLCRTEHMFFDGVAHHRGPPDDPGRHEKGRRARRSTSLLPEQRSDFLRSSRSWPACRCTIRLLDPPLHEFLPTRRASSRKSPPLPTRRRHCCVAAPPRLARVQPDARPSRLPARRHVSRDLRDAGACDFRGRDRGRREGRRGPDPRSHDAAGRHGRELELMKARRRQGGRGVIAEKGADRISHRHDDRAAARGAARGRDRRIGEFFSFGTNDLTQTTFGVSPRRRRVASWKHYVRRASTPAIRSSASMSRASAS